MSEPEKCEHGNPIGYYCHGSEGYCRPANDSISSTCSLPPFVQTAFVFAARYTHHRNTGGTLAVCRALAYVWPDLSESTKEQILKESHEATTNLREWREFRGDEDQEPRLEAAARTSDEILGRACRERIAELKPIQDQ